MKIEKINENQIRCTLTKEDLESHQIRISELAYGTDKAKKLFRDMMEQAALQFGFEADNIPLMIEAIPVSAESIILIVTKVEDPEELDTRFSKFAPFRGNDSVDTLQLDGADNIIDIFQRLCEAKLKSLPKKSQEKFSPLQEAQEEKEDADTPDVELVRLFEFQNLDDVIAAAHGLNGYFTGNSILYKYHDSYKLVLRQSGCTPEELNKVCNILSEYGAGKAFTVSAEAFLKEHAEVISENALLQLAQL